MGWVTLQDTPITLDPNTLATDEGWTISQGVAYHDGCFPGTIILRDTVAEVEAGKSYVLTYNLKYYTSGMVQAIVGGVEGTEHTAIGEHTETFNVPEDATDLSVKFYSDGTLGISYFNIYPVLEDPNNGVTVAFNADKNTWTTDYSWRPQMMLKFGNDLFSWDGEAALWKHNVNETRNLFYGVQYDSEIEIILNINPTEAKNLYSMRVNSNLAWEVSDIYIRPIVGKENGQRSRIKKGNFTKINGQFFADFLKDMTDPRFDNELTALFKGADLQGTVASITLRSDETGEVRLVSVDILGAPQQYTY